MLVEKRDGRTVEYDRLKIAHAVHQAMYNVGAEPELAPANEEEGKCNSYSIALLVDAKLQEINQEKISVEAIQDLVENVLIEQNLPDVAKHYILYRDKRSTIRSIHSKMNKAIKGLVDVTADSDDKRENANINSDTTMGTMLKVGTTVMKDFNLKNIYKPEYSKLHNTGYIHMHDLDFSSLCVNCLYLPLTKLLKNGFSTGHGFLRSPKSIRAAAALTCIAIQSSQNDFFGGQAIPSLDYALAPYVALTYIRECREFLRDADNPLPDDILKNEFVKPFDEFVYKNEFNGIYSSRDLIRKTVQELYLKHLETAVDDVFLDKMLEVAERRTANETEQSFEALVHNLCSMASRAGSQTPFSSVNFGLCTSWEGRLVSKSVMKAQYAGLGLGETAIFPISIFKMKKGITDQGSPNYDLFQQACKTSAFRLYPKVKWGILK